MKYGEYFKTQIEEEWRKYYMDYDQLKNILKNMEESELPVSNGGIGASLSTPVPTTSQGLQLGQIFSQEEFFHLLDEDMRKIEDFTKSKVEEYREELLKIEEKLDRLLKRYSDRSEMLNDPQTEFCREQLQECGNSFLRLEKFVNLNFIGFIKILKKHDKHLPNPCRAFYTTRLNEQKWVQGDYSNIMVALSRIYSKLRSDKVVEETETAKQNFTRSTKKYWVHNEDISYVKFIILQHLPIFLQNGMSGDSDAQLTSSVYLDNDAMDLYYGRLEKSPGAIAVRFRWYGTKPVDTVYVERKTHREKWMGEMSVKERFTVKEPQVVELLQGRFDINAEIDRLRNKGKKEADIEDYRVLATEIADTIRNKRLYPTMRTQYMRTAFQIPFDPSVRISIDTNLTMINDRTPETVRCERWYRESGKKPIPAKDITRFPHAVLEIKLQLQDEADTPSWVTDLIHSGKLMEVHKFSKFIHGCAVLLSEAVPAMPYWIDDVTLADSIIRSGAEEIILGAETRQDNPMLPHNAQGIAKVKIEAMLREAAGVSTQDTVKRYVFTPLSSNSNSSKKSVDYKPGNLAKPATLQSSTLDFSFFNTSSATNRMSVSLSPHHAGVPGPDMRYSVDLGGARRNQQNSSSKNNNNHSNNISNRSDDAVGLCHCCEMAVSACPILNSTWADPVSASMKQLSLQKVEPKTYFANERTFITWMNMAVFMSSMSIAVMAFASNDNSSALVFPFMLLPLSLLFIGYALNTYLKRGTKIKARDSERWDDPYGPPLLSTLLIMALIAIFIVRCVQLSQE